MKICFLNPEKLDAVKERINEDSEFRIAAKFMSVDILFEVGDSKSIFSVRDGILIKNMLNPAPIDKWNYFIKGPEKSWQKLLQPFPPAFFQGFFSAAMREDFEFGGDVELLFSYYWATQRMITVIREFQNE